MLTIMYLCSVQVLQDNIMQKVVCKNTRLWKLCLKAQQSAMISASYDTLSILDDYQQMYEFLGSEYSCYNDVAYGAISLDTF